MTTELINGHEHPELIAELFSDCTVITAAHRLSTIVSSNRILFLSEG